MISFDKLSHLNYAIAEVFTIDDFVEESQTVRKYKVQAGFPEKNSQNQKNGKKEFWTLHFKAIHPSTKSISDFSKEKHFTMNDLYYDVESSLLFQSILVRSNDWRSHKILPFERNLKNRVLTFIGLDLCEHVTSINDMLYLVEHRVDNRLKYDIGLVNKFRTCNLKDQLNFSDDFELISKISNFVQNSMSLSSKPEK